MARPRFQDGDPEKIEEALRCVWVLVELMRDRRRGGERYRVREASRRLAEKIKKEIVTSGERLRHLHMDAEKRRAIDPYFATYADQELARVRQSRTVRGWNRHPLDLLLNL
jgi:hypothetical protein